MATFTEAFDIANPVFRSYAFWSVVLVLKMMAMSVLTAMQRVKNKVCQKVVRLQP